MIAERWKIFLKWWRVWRVPASLAIAFTVLWLLRAPLISRISLWRADTAAAEAQQLADAGNWRPAEAAARRALQLDRQRYDALRILMEASIRNGHGESLRLAAAVFYHAESTPVDQTRALELILLAGDQVGFRRLLSGLSPEQRSDPGIYLQETRYLSHRGEHELALQRIEGVPQGADANLVRLVHAEVLLGAHRYREAQAKIATMEEDPDGAKEDPKDFSQHLAALDLLRAVPLDELDPSLRGLVHGWLNALVASLDSDLVRASDRLLLDSFALAAAGKDPARREEVIARALATYAESDPEALGPWLFSVGEGTRFITAITKEVALASEALFFLRLRALTDADDWPGAKAWLARAGSGLNSTRVEVSRAITARHLGENSEAMVRWRNAMRDASIRASGNVYWNLGSLAMAHEEWDWAAEAILKASQDPAAVLPPASDLAILVDALARRDQLAEPIALTAAWIAREPENPSLYSNFLYLNLLAGTPVADGTQKAAKLSRTFPGMNVFLGTHALALLVEGREDEALALLSDKSLNWNAATPTTRAIRARLEAGPARKPVFPEAAFLYPAERRLLGL